MSKPIARPGWLTAEQAAKYLGMDATGLYKLLAKGPPYCPRFHRNGGKGSPYLFRERWLEEWIDSKLDAVVVTVKPTPKGRPPKPNLPPRPPGAAEWERLSELYPLPKEKTK